MNILPPKSSLPDIQSYLLSVLRARGFQYQDIIERALLLGEEVGELYTAIRKERNLPIDQHSSCGNIEEEIADIFIVLVSIANAYGIDIDTALRRKEEKNQKRVWT